MMIATLLLAIATEAMTFTADRVAVDNVTKAATATGHVHAVAGFVSLYADMLERDAQGVVHLGDPTTVTSCTNQLGHTHWNVRGSIEYRAEDYVIVRNAWLRFYEIPVFYLPYLYYPLDSDCGFSWMPGWTSEWGTYLMTKYSYHLLGDRNHGTDTYWLKANTRFDWREEQGLALGEDFKWQLNGFGRGKMKIYYAWDRSDNYAADGMRNGDYNYANWGSSVPENRYGLEFGHLWEPTERDTVHIKGSYFSDSYFREDFFRESFFNIKNQWLGYDGNEVAWEHQENTVAAGIGVSGPLNSFYGGTKRLPELYLDVAPMPLFGLPVNYESESRIGYLGRQAAEYGRYSQNDNPFGYNPGPWASYDTFRFDTYHRLTAPFKTASDVLSVVPRLAYRGSYWNACGGTDVYGYDRANVGQAGGGMYRSIPEAGITFAARGTGWVNDSWQHAMEPYLDVLAQHASYDGAGEARRPFIFDNLDASVQWEDQFAGRSRNLPYTYYGITPGFRQAWAQLKEDGSLRTILDVDVYAAVQFNQTDWYEQNDLNPDLHRLAVPGSPNYGENAGMVVPGGRVRWNPDDDISLMGNIEYDSERNRIALANLLYSQKVSRDLKWSATYMLRDSRWWDYSSSPASWQSDDLNRVYSHTGRLALEQHPIDWFAWSPFVRWDLKDGELDCTGAWFDYLTDCLGFRLTLSYDSKYTTLDGYEHKERFHVGFMLYLRALGSDSANIFNN